MRTRAGIASAQPVAVTTLLVNSQMPGCWVAPLMENSYDRYDVGQNHVEHNVGETSDEYLADVTAIHWILERRCFDQPECATNLGDILVTEAEALLIVPR